MLRGSAKFQAIARLLQQNTSASPRQFLLVASGASIDLVHELVESLNLADKLVRFECASSAGSFAESCEAFSSLSRPVGLLNPMGIDGIIKKTDTHCAPLMAALHPVPGRAAIWVVFVDVLFSRHEHFIPTIHNLFYQKGGGIAFYQMIGRNTCEENVLDRSRSKMRGVWAEEPIDGGKWAGEPAVEAPTFKPVGHFTVAAFPSAPVINLDDPSFWAKLTGGNDPTNPPT